jgi:acetyl-CoA carboxylase carboxyl transferase subunit beta
MSWLKKLMPARIPHRYAVDRKTGDAGRHCGKRMRALRSGAVPARRRKTSVCPKCSFHMPIRARAVPLLDDGLGVEIGAALGPVDVLKFRIEEFRNTSRPRRIFGKRDDALRWRLGQAEGPGPGRRRSTSHSWASMGSGSGRALHPSPPGVRWNLVAVCVFLREAAARHAGNLFSLMQMAKIGRARALCARRRPISR